MKYWFLILFLPAFFSWSQINEINSCSGSIDIGSQNEIDVVFPAFKGLDRSMWTTLIEKPISKNSVWLKFEPDFKGKLEFNCRIYLDSFDIVILRVNSASSCKEIESGTAFPVLIKPNTSCEEMENAYINVDIGYTYFLIFHAEEKREDNIHLDFDFKKESNSSEEKTKPLVLNLVYNNETSVFCFVVLDSENKNPVPSRISISNTGELDGTYLASNLFINISRSIKNGSVKVDAAGYLSKDLDHYVIKKGQNKVIKDTVYLKKLKRGQIAKLDKLYFEAGTANILDESLPKIRRLRDFLVLNSSVKIEIQGHVNIDGSKRSAKKLSKKRAKEIIKFLVNNGINKSRLSAQGFGYSKPVYESPKTEEEKEANRRVEIMIK